MEPTSDPGQSRMSEPSNPLLVQVSLSVKPQGIFGASVALILLLFCAINLHSVLSNPEFHIPSSR